MVDVVSIDPGKSGALAWLDLGEREMGVAALEADGPDTLWPQLSSLIEEDTVVYSEDVGYGRPGSNVRAVTTFSRHCGMLEGMLYVLPSREVRYVSPQRWMRQEFPDRPTGESSVGARKLYIMEGVESWLDREGFGLEEDSRVTLSNSDALGLMMYALKDGDGEFWSLPDVRRRVR